MSGAEFEPPDQQPLDPQMIGAELRREWRLMRDRVQQCNDALLKIGQLTRWVGWIESRLSPDPKTNSQDKMLNENPVAKDMREIKRIAEEVTGLSFEEYT